jgi:heme o synthase
MSVEMSMAGRRESGSARALVGSAARPSDYLALVKPRVMSLVMFTALTGMLFAPSSVDPVIGFASLFAIAGGAGACGALNMSDIDALMRRTRHRPIPAGRMSKGEALCFGLILAVFSVMSLGLIANWLSAALLGFTIFFYVAIYTIWLKLFAAIAGERLAGVIP